MHSLSAAGDNIQCKKEDIAAEIQRLMDIYGKDVLRTSYMYLKDRQRAEDAFQEVFCKVYRKYEDFRGESSEKTWLIKVTINVCKDMLRSSWLKRVLVTDRMSSRGTTSDIGEGIIRRDENRALFSEVLSLPPVLREVIILYYYHGCDSEEISRILNVPGGTVRSRLHRARESLRTKIGGRIFPGE